MNYLKKNILHSLLLLMLISVCACSPSPSCCSSIHIPVIEKFKLDGNGDEWTDKGFDINMLTSPSGKVLPASDFDVRLKIGWNNKGLLFFAKIRDDLAFEHDQLENLRKYDCIELLVGEEVGVYNRYHLVLAPGLDKRHPDVRMHWYDRRTASLKTGNLKSGVRRIKDKDGYSIEIQLPWSNLQLNPEKGLTLAFQFVANDFDGDDDMVKGFQVAWYPAIAPLDPRSMHRLHLSDKASDPVLTHVNRISNRDGFLFEIIAAEELKAETVLLSHKNGKTLRSNLKPDDGRALCTIQAPFPDSTCWAETKIQVAGKTVKSYSTIPVLQSVFERFASACGGGKQLKSIQSVHITGRWESDLSWQTPRHQVVPINIFIEAPDKWLFVEETDSTVSKRGFVNGKGWKETEKGIESTTYRDIAGPLWLLNPLHIAAVGKSFSSAQLIERFTYKGKDVVRTDISLYNEKPLELLFDMQTGLIVKCGWLEIEDYQEAGGLTYPKTYYANRKGGWSRLHLDKVVFNDSKNPVDFSKP